MLKKIKSGVACPPEKFLGIPVASKLPTVLGLLHRPIENYKFVLDN